MGSGLPMSPSSLPESPSRINTSAGCASRIKTWRGDNSRCLYQRKYRQGFSHGKRPPAVMLKMRGSRYRLNLLEAAYVVTDRLLRVFSRWIRPGSKMVGAIAKGEKISKGLLFDCRMCGQCILRSTGMTCPMTCPKNLRNGPCGGVRQDGSCEVDPHMPCVWGQAWERSKISAAPARLLQIRPPMDFRLEGSSAWVNDISGRAHQTPKGWSE